MNYLFSFVIIASFAGITLSDPRACYECIDCPDPFDKTNSSVAVDDCLDLEKTRGLGSLSLTDNDVVHGNNTVCVKLEGSKNGTSITQRGCFYNSVNNTDICTYVEDILEGTLNVTSCQTCDSDMCNASSRMVTSISTLLIGFILLISPIY